MYFMLTIPKELFDKGRMQSLRAFGYFVKKEGWKCKIYNIV